MSVLFDDTLPTRRNVGWHEGFRIWTVDMEERLVPSVAEARFRPGYRIEAACPKGKSVPCYQPCLGFGHGCGIYAVKTEEMLPGFEYAQFVRSQSGASAIETLESGKTIGVVSARIALWGTVIEHQTGYRGEKAYPLEFLEIKLNDPDDPRHARIRYYLEEAWDVPFRRPAE